LRRKLRGVAALPELNVRANRVVMGQGLQRAGEH
jgi:hypothetical protein